MPLEVQCPGCSTRYRVGDDKGGKRLRCKKCQEVITVPVPSRGGRGAEDPFGVFDNTGGTDADPFGMGETAYGSQGETFDDGGDMFGGFDMGSAFNNAPTMPPAGAAKKPKSKSKKKGSSRSSGGGDNTMLIGVGLGALVVIGLAIGAFVFFAGKREVGGPGAGGGGGGFDVAGGGAGSRVETGSLAPGDQTLANGEYADTYTVDLEVGQRVSVSLNGNGFDSYLMLETPSGAVYENDDAGGLSFSAIRMPAPEAGTYKVTVTSFDTGESGSYSLDIAVAPQATAQVVQGTLENGDALGLSGAFEDTIPFQGRRGQRVMVLMTSNEVDSFVRLVGPNGVPLSECDDAGSGTDSLLTTVLPADGEYRIQATTFEPGTAGGYTLVIDQTEPVDRIETGSLAFGDQTLETGEYHDIFTIDGTSGQKISISLSSTEFDPYLLLIAPSGEQFDNDDFLAYSSNSEIVLTLPESGQYDVGVTSFEPGETGSYVLAIDFE